MLFKQDNKKMNERNFDNISDKKNFITLTFYDAEHGEIYDIECSPSDKLIDVVKKKMKRWQYVYHDFIYENKRLNIDLTVEKEGIHDKAKILMINQRMCEG